MKHFDGLQQSYRFLVAHRLMSFIVLTLIGISSFAGSLLVSRVFPVHASNTSNLVANAGFESPLGGKANCSPPPQSVGNWESWSGGVSPAPTEVTSPIHSGAQSGEVNQLPGSTCSNAAFYQDFPSFPANTSYEFSTWVYPVSGEQQMTLFFGWDHQSTSQGSSDISVYPDHTWVSAWGQGLNTSAISYNTWHQLALVADAGSLTARFYVDGVLIVTTPRGTVLPQLEASVLLGQGFDANSASSTFYFDDVSLSLATPAQTSITDPVLFVHGFIQSSGTDCSWWWNMAKDYLQGKGHPGLRFTGTMDMLGYYIHDDPMGCTDNLSTPGSDWCTKCTGYDGTAEREVGTIHESIRHLACELAWYIYDKYSQYGTNIRIVAHSMGGLITRYALYAVQNSKTFTTFPKSLYVSDIVDFDTPHNGLDWYQATAACFPVPLGFCYQGKQMRTSDGFMQELINHAQNPQGSGQGTHWTLLGVANSQKITCDGVNVETSLSMDGAVKVAYEHCYKHSDYDSMMHDNNVLLDAAAYYCDPVQDSNCTRNDPQNYTSWHYSTTYPHPLNKMYLSLLIAEYPIPTAGSQPLNITAGPDGNLWFTESSADQIGRITPTGVIAQFSGLTVGSDPSSITVGPDGNLWFTEFVADKIGRITPAGVVTGEFPVSGGITPSTIVVGPDKNLWFDDRDGNLIWRMTTDGVVTGKFPIPTVGSGPIGMAAGPDGNLWFTERDASKIGRITPAGVVTGEFPTRTANSYPNSITVGPDGNLWFDERDANKIGRITTAGVITGEFPVPTANSDPGPLTVGPDGNLWFAELNGNKIARITTTGAITEMFQVPTASSSPDGITAGPDGNLWFTELNGDQIGRVTFQ